MPIKMLIHPDTALALEMEHIYPTHIQLVLTNRCNLLCPFCSYSAVDRKLELTLAEITKTLQDFADQGAIAVTITGGGEPTLHPDFNAVVDAALDMDYAVGMITNGTLLERVRTTVLSQLVWCRISCSDHWDYDKYQKGVRTAVMAAPDADWGMSYVVGCGADFKLANLVACVRMANELEMKYVRVVSDLTHPDKATSMEVVAHVLAINDVDDSRVIYQGRKNTTPGFKQCWCSLVKPYIGADGGIYPCCGVQYAEEEISFNTPVAMRMGTIEDIKTIWNAQTPYNGSKCVRCHYHQYNTVWNQLKQGVDHADFI